MFKEVCRQQKIKNTENNTIQIDKKIILVSIEKNSNLFIRISNINVYLTCQNYNLYRLIYRIFDVFPYETIQNLKFTITTQKKQKKKMRLYIKFCNQSRYCNKRKN